ncbi:MAG: phosphonate C-P lyase system protein PhnH [Pseudomonadota bacterium]
MPEHAKSHYLDGGLSEPVFQAQSTFRAVMKAMAEPGLIVNCEPATIPPKPLQPLAATVCCTLCDADTSIYLDEQMRGTAGVETWLSFHTGARIQATATTADFALISDVSHLPTLESFAHGTQDYPDRSTTLIVQIAALSGDDPVTLTGPGIKKDRVFAPKGLPSHFISSWADNHALFPRGVDIIFTSRTALACLPRSTRIKTGER